MKKIVKWNCYIGKYLAIQSVYRDSIHHSHSAVIWEYNITNFPTPALQ